MYAKLEIRIFILQTNHKSTNFKKVRLYYCKNFNHWLNNNIEVHIKESL